MQRFAATSSLDGPIPRKVDCSLSSLCAVKRGWVHVVLCKVLSGASYRLRPTSKIGEFIRGSNLLSEFGVSLAEACAAGTRDWWRPGLQERSNGCIASAARQARCIRDRVCKASRRV